MRLLILLFAISRLSESSLPYRGVTVGISPYVRPVVSQYHRQDNNGHYIYGYATGLSSQDETKTADGVTRGGYSYIDANGILQTVQYISDPVNGFRVLATNIPRDLPEVEHARAQHLAQFEHIKAEHAHISEQRKQQALAAVISPLPVTGSYVVPVKTNVVANLQPIIVADAPVREPIPVAAVVPIAPAIPISTQYHTQDSIGQYSYGYADPLSAKSETKTADGVTRGGYSYIDANGILQTVQYVSDPVNGFRVTATNLPEAPSVTLIGPKVTATVAGPKENNVVAVAPAADTVITQQPINVVPAHPAYVDSIGIEQKPVLVQADIVPNANVLNTHPQGPYLQLNPNHEAPVVYSNHELGVPYQPAGSAALEASYINAGAPPIPVTHSQAVLHNNGGPSTVAHHQITPQLQHPEQVLLAPHPPIVDQHQPPRQILLSPAAYSPSASSNQLPLSPDSHYPVGAEHAGQIFIGPNQSPGHGHGAHQIPLASHEVSATSHDQPTNYYYPQGGTSEYAAPIDADAINSGPINQQVLNHAQPQPPLPVRTGNDVGAYVDSSAYPDTYAYAENPAPAYANPQYDRTLFVPNGSTATGIQQVYQQQAPVEHDSQTGVEAGHEQQQTFVLGPAEHGAQTPPLHLTQVKGQHAPQEQQGPVSAPSGYYTHNIEY